MKNAIKLCRHWFDVILADSLCLEVLTTWFPLVFSYPRLFQNVNPDSHCGGIADDLPRFFCPEADEDIWVEKERVLKAVSSPPLPKQESGARFMLSLISGLFLPLGFQVPFPHPKYDLDSCSGNAFLLFIADLMAKAQSPVLENLFVSFFEPNWEDRDSSDFFAPVLLRAILQKIPDSQSEVFDMVVENLFILAGLFSLAQVALPLMHDVLNATDLILKKKKIATLAHYLLVLLFRAVPVAGYADVFTLFGESVDAFVRLVKSQNGLHSWLFMFLTSCSRLRLQSFKEFLGLLTGQLSTSPTDQSVVQMLSKGKLDHDLPMLSTLETAWKDAWNHFQSAFTSALSEMRKKRSGDDRLNRVSGEFTKNCSLTNMNHYYLGHLLGNSLRISTLHQELDNEERAWQLITDLLKDPQANSHVLSNDKADARKIPAEAPTRRSSTSFPKLVLSPGALTDDAAGGQRAVNDLLPLGTSRRTEEFQIFPIALPMTAPLLLSKVVSETIRLDLPRLFRVTTRFVYTRSSSFRSNILEIFRSVIEPYGQILEFCGAELSRYSAKIPAVVFLLPNHLLILTSATLSSTKNDLVFDGMDLGQLRFFIESVLMGHWGQTSIFSSRIVICVKRSSIAYTEKRPDGFHIWSLENGVFALTLRDPSPAIEQMLSATEDRLPRLGFLHQIASEDDLASVWRAGRLSVTDLLLRLNALRGRSFIDLEHYPVFPDLNHLNLQVAIPQKDVIMAKLAPLNPFNFLAPKAERRDAAAIPADFFFHSMGENDGPAAPMMRRAAIERDGRLSPWIHGIFSFRLSSRANLPVLQFGKLRDRDRYICQALNIQAGPRLSVLYDADTVTVAPYVREALVTVDGGIVAHDPSVGISVRNRKKQTLYMTVDPLLPFLSSITVGEFGLYFVADLDIGTTIAYRLEYSNSGLSFSETSRFESDGVPSTIVLDSVGVCATAHSVGVVLWNVWTGIVHRRLKFDSRVTSISADSLFNCFLVATVGNVYYINVNGEVICESPLESRLRISVSRFVILPSFELARCAFCGTTSGEVWLMRPDFESKRIAMQSLASLHCCEIQRLVMHERRGGMLSVDMSGAVCAWACEGDVRTPKLRPDIFVSYSPPDAGPRRSTGSI
jgi:hypothetical protein